MVTSTAIPPFACFMLADGFSYFSPGEMPLVKIMGTLWLVTVILVVPIAAAKGIPVLHVFAPIQSWYTFVPSVFVSALIALQYFDQTYTRPYSPALWGGGLALLCAWVSIVYQLCQSHEE